MSDRKRRYSNVLDRLDRDGLIKFTSDLVRIDSVYAPEIEGANESKVTDYLVNFLSKEGFEVKIEEAAPGRASVIAFYRGEEPGRTILFEGHQDVVSAGDLSDWSYDPFGAEIGELNGRKVMYGRGTNDTKGNLAAAVYAVKAIRDSGQKFKGNIILCLPVDEEGMMIGIKDCIKKGYFDEVDAAVVCEPEDGYLCLFQKGALRITVTLKGKMAHGCMPLSGTNPNWGLARFINELRRLEEFEKDRVGEHEYLGYPSITPTVIRAPRDGIAQINVLPGNSYLTLDIRTVPGQDHEALKRQLQGIIYRLSRQYRGEDDRFEAEMKVIEERPWTETPGDDPIVRAADSAYRELTGEEPVYSGVPGATDGTFISAWKGIPVLVTGAGDREVPHQADEWVYLDDLVEIARFYILTALYYLNQDIT